MIYPFFGLLTLLLQHIYVFPLHIHSSTHPVQCTSKWTTIGKSGSYYCCDDIIYLVLQNLVCIGWIPKEEAGLKGCLQLMYSFITPIWCIWRCFIPSVMAVTQSPVTTKLNVFDRKRKPNGHQIEGNTTKRW